MAGFLGYSTSGAKWSGTTITYSFASTTTATVAGGAFSGIIPVQTDQATFDPAYTPYYAVLQALNAWAQSTGITLKRVADSTAAGGLPDIRIGYGALTAGLGAFTASVVNGTFQPGSEIMLQDPAKDAIGNDTLNFNPSARYATGQFVTLVAESAIGHALGLAETTGPSIRLRDAGNAIPAAAGDASPALINTASVAGVEALYGTKPQVVYPASLDPSLPDGAGGSGLTSYTFNVANTVGAVYARLPTGNLVSLTADGTIQLQANQPGSAVVTVPGARVIGQQGASPRIFFAQGISDPTGNMERVARLYQAEFGRVPDLNGLYNYGDAIDRGAQSLVGVANLLAVSPEFIAAHPEASGTSASANAAFVDVLYRNLFGRPMDAAGAGYVTALQNGTSRGEVANNIAQSLESRLAYLPYEGDRSLGMIYRSYEAAFGRVPDSSGLAAYMPLLDAGLSARDFAAALIGGAEFAATAGAGGNVSFINQTYQNALGRTPDAGGLANYAGLMAGGTSRANVLAAIADSNEARARSALATHDGWVSV